MKEDIYSFSALDNLNNEIHLSNFKGKVLLIVNSASHSSYSYKYAELEKTYTYFKPYGFEILDFPCNQFHGESPLSDKETDEFIISNYHTTYKRMKKVEVNGENAPPLFKYLQKKKKFNGFDYTDPLSSVIASIHIKEGPFFEKDNSIKWNFTYFLIDRNGKVYKRMECTSKEEEVNKAIKRLVIDV